MAVGGAHVATLHAFLAQDFDTYEELHQKLDTELAQTE
jgi:hypothetical protein